MIERRKFLLLVFVIAVAFASFFAFVFNHPVESDAIRYDRVALNIASKGAFSLSEQEPFLPTMFVEPLYPFNLSILYSLFGTQNYLAVKIFQILVFGITVILVYFLAEETFGRKIANYSAISAALCPPLANYPSYLLVETVFTFLLCLTILILTKAVKTRKVLLFFISGVLLGLTTLCKAITVLFFLIVIFGLLLLRKKMNFSFKKMILYSVVFMLSFVTIIFPWVYRNYKIFNSFNISLRGDLALWMRANKLDDTWEDTRYAFVYNFSEYLGSLLYPEASQNPREFILADCHEAYARQRKLLSDGYDIVQANYIIRKEALQKIKERPLKYLAQTFLELEKMSAFMYVPTLNETHIINKFYRLKNGRLLLSGIRGFFRLTAYPLIMLALMGMWFDRKLWPKCYFFIAMIVYINLIYSLLFGLGRYAVPIIPFYLIFASAAIPRLKWRFL